MFHFTYSSLADALVAFRRLLSGEAAVLMPHEANQLIASWAVMASRAEAIAWIRLG
jgi:hypothetical protein